MFVGELTEWHLAKINLQVTIKANHMHICPSSQSFGPSCQNKSCLMWKKTTSLTSQKISVPKYLPIFGKNYAPETNFANFAETNFAHNIFSAAKKMAHSRPIQAPCGALADVVKKFALHPTLFACRPIFFCLNSYFTPVSPLVPIFLPPVLLIFPHPKVLFFHWPDCFCSSVMFANTYQLRRGRGQNILSVSDNNNT